MVTPDTRLEDFIGLGHTKLGFFKEVQIKIKELQASNLKLAQKQQQIQAILDGITDVMAVISSEYRIKSVNHVFHKIFAHPEAVGRCCYEVFRDRSRPCSPCPLEEALEANDVRRQMHIYTLNNENRQFEITAAPLRDAEGRSKNVLLLKRDVTIEKAYQAQYYQAEKMATIGLLAAGVAHEINNPLTAISGFAEGLKRRLPKLEKMAGRGGADLNLIKDVDEYVHTILTECNRCRDIVQNLLTFSPRQQAVFSAVDLNGLVMDVIKLLEHQLKKKLYSAICLDLEPELPRLQGIVAELKQVVLNLVLNALDAVRDSGQITIQTQADSEGEIRLVVADTGCGIAPEHIDKLFEPFFTTKPVGRGVGVGLSTCYNIIQKHEGEILVQSFPRRGARFEVRLPGGS